ncbi:hypothetical protein V6N13_105618 [Hibiscus sabdariffa]
MVSAGRIRAMEAVLGTESSDGPDPEPTASVLAFNYQNSEASRYLKQREWWHIKMGFLRQKKEHNRDWCEDEDEDNGEVGFVNNGYGVLIGSTQQHGFRHFYYKTVKITTGVSVGGTFSCSITY